MSPGYYKLNDKHEPYEVTMEEWATSAGGYRVDLTKLENGIKVSTVFLGLDHNYEDGPPILFETMIFGGKHDEYQERYSTWDEAVEGHARAVKLASE